MSDDHTDLAAKIKEAEEEASKQAQAHAQQFSDQDASELEKLKEELENVTSLAQRTMADFQNYKRRHEEEKNVIFTMANIGLIKGLLPVLDNLQRSESEWTEGIKICVKQLESVLQSNGLEEIDAANQAFDPDFHEALLQGPGASDTVIEVLEKGYKVGDRVIRHAKVKVGNGEKND